MEPSRPEPVLTPVASLGATTDRWYALTNLAIAVFLVVLLALAAIARIEGDGLVLFGRTMPETCFWRLVFHRPCAGCGTTRSVVLALHGRWGEARAMHPAGVWVLGYLVFQLAARLTLLAVRPRGPTVAGVDLALSVGLLLGACYIPLFL